MLTSFLMWFPSCALFVAVAYITELAWGAEDKQIVRGLRVRFFQVQRRERRVLMQEDGKPLLYLD